MTGYVVDASIVVKWLVKEKWSAEASGLLEAEATLIAPELVFAEVCNALWSMRGRGDFRDADLADAMDMLRAAPIAIPLSMRQLAASAARLAADLDHPAYDCFYLAPALHEHYPVVTADLRFHPKVRDHPYLSERVMYVTALV